jgi:hypothetical protein
MRTPAIAARLAQTENAASLVLEAERAALTEVEHYRLQMLRLVATSCLRAELVRKRAETRIQRLRERMKATAQLRQERISCEMQAVAGVVGTDSSKLALLDGAIHRVAEELAGTAESS